MRIECVYATHSYKTVLKCALFLFVDICSTNVIENVV